MKSAPQVRLCGIIPHTDERIPYLQYYLHIRDLLGNNPRLYWSSISYISHIDYIHPYGVYTSPVFSNNQTHAHNYARALILWTVHTGITVHLDPRNEMLFVFAESECH